MCNSSTLPLLIGGHSASFQICLHVFVFLPLITVLPHGLIPVYFTCQEFFACISSLVGRKLDCLSLLPVASCHIWSKNEPLLTVAPRPLWWEYSPPLKLTPHQHGSCSVRSSCSQLLSPLAPLLGHTPSLQNVTQFLPGLPLQVSGQISPAQQAFPDHQLK